MKGAVGIIGRGDIASALAARWTHSSDPEVRVVQDAAPAEMAAVAGMLVVDAGEADARTVLRSLPGDLTDDVTVVSCAQGISLSALRAWLGPGPGLVKAAGGPGIDMGRGVVVLCADSETSSDSVGAVARLFACLGTVESVTEDTLDAAAAVIRSGVAFLATALEGMEDGAVDAGLPRATARAFVRQTAFTTALLLVDHPGSPADLKDQVASPGGTTISGLGVLEDRAVRGAFVRAVRKASDKDPVLRDGGGSPVVE